MAPRARAVIDVNEFPSLALAMDYVEQVRSNMTLWEYHHAWRSRPFSLKFLHLLRYSLPNLFCTLDIVNRV